LLFQAEHIFSGHLLQRFSDGPVERFVYTPVWPGVLMMLGLVLLAIVKYRDYPRVYRIVISTFNKQVLQQLEREEAGTGRTYAVILNSLFIFSLAFILYKVNQFYGLIWTGKGGLLQFTFVLTFCLVVYLFKTFFTKMLGNISGGRRLTTAYLLNSSFINQTAALFLFPMAALIEFGRLNAQLMIYLAVALLLFTILMRWYRGLLLSIAEERIGILEIFSYFCGLEILPVLVLVKYLLETF
jgi:hypothetical protein